MSRFFKCNTTPKPSFKKRFDFKSKTTLHDDPKYCRNEEQDIKRVPSPVMGEDTPEFCVYFHSRERNKRTVLSTTASITPSKFGEVIALWILDRCVKMNYNPVALAWGVFSAVKSTYEDLQNGNATEGK